MSIKKTILLAIVFLFSSVSYAQRYALVIGNSNYKIGFLKNPVNDASDMAALLGKKGFQVQKLIDANREQMEQAIHQFTQQLHQKGSVGLFYFAGHGIEVEGQNYLLPVGKYFQSETDVEYSAVNAGRVLTGMRRAGNGLNMVILDACRDNPFARSFRSSSRGLAKMEARGSMVFYATSPGDLASDGNGRNGLFTQHLMASIDTPNLTIDQVFNKTVNKVAGATGDKQIPWKSGVIINSDQFRFTINAPKVETITINRPVDNTRQAEIVYWDGIKNETTPDFFRSYLQKYPQGIYVELAKIKIQRDGTIVVVNPPKSEKQETARLTIKTSPDKARIRILNIAPKYQPGIELKRGRYHIEVSQKGYKRHTEWIELKNEDTIYSVVLEEKQQFTPVTQARITSRPSRKDNSGIDMVFIPSGCFQMGSNDSRHEKPVHRVCLSTYEIGQYEVTQAQWKKVMRNNPSHFKGSNKPVEQVSWDDVQKFIRQLNQQTGQNFRLPTEAEWEYACRSGGRDQKYCGGNNASSLAWYNENSDDTTHNVGQKQANGLGLYDMSGNVWEWVQDWYNGDYYNNSPINNPKGASGGSSRVYRGGSWYNGTSRLRSANRSGFIPGDRFGNVGFRLARTP